MLPDVSDNFDVIRIQKIFRTTTPPLPLTIDSQSRLTQFDDVNCKNYDSIQSYHIKDCLKSYNGDNILIKPKFSQYSTSVCPPSYIPDVTEAINDLQEQLYESDYVHDSDKELCTSMEKVKLQRTSSFMPLFIECTQEKKNSRCFEYRSSADLVNEENCIRLLIRCISAKFEMEVEPFYYSIALFDLRTRRKLTENFNFDMNTNALRRMIPSQQHVDSSSISRSALFSIKQPHPDIYFVIRVEKILQQGDINDCIDPYTKTDQKLQSKTQNITRIAENARCYCERLGRYRMPFGWAAISLRNLTHGSREINHGFTLKASSLDRRSSNQNSRSLIEKRSRTRDESVGCRMIGGDCNSELGICARKNLKFDHLENYLKNMAATVITLKYIYKMESDRLTDEDIMKFLSDYKKSSFTKRLKPIPITLRIEFSSVRSVPEGCLDPDLYHIKPVSDQIRRPIKEVLEFNDVEDLCPNKFYRNILYVYPIHLSMIVGARANCRARNIGIKVQFMIGEDCKHAVPVIFNKSGTLEMQREAFLPVLYHMRNPSFYEEIKIQLPAILTRNTHLLFTIYHISCQKKDDVPLETPVGFTWLPISKPLLCKDERSYFHLPIAHELPHDYSSMSPFNECKGVRWIDNMRAAFTVKLKLISSIHPQDEYLESFFDYAGQYMLLHSDRHCIDDLALRISLEELVKSRRASLFKFSYVVMDKLLALLCNDETSSSSTSDGSNETNLMSSLAFNAIVKMVDIISAGHTAIDSIGSELVEHKSTPYRCPALVSYLHLYCQLPYKESGNCMDILTSSKKTLHEEIVSQWGLSSDPVKQLAASNAWFFFEMTIRSLILCSKNSAGTNFCKVALHSSRFYDDLNVLIHLLVDDVIIKSSNGSSEEDSEIATQLNWSIAFFLHDSITILDPNFIMELLQIYLKKLQSATMADLGVVIYESLKWECLQIICSHEHFMKLTCCESVKPRILDIVLENIHGLLHQDNWNFNHSFYDCYLKAFKAIKTVFLVSERRCRIEGISFGLNIFQIARMWRALVAFAINFKVPVSGRAKDMRQSVMSMAGSVGCVSSTENDTCNSKRNSVLITKIKRDMMEDRTAAMSTLNCEIFSSILWIFKYLERESLIEQWSQLSESSKSDLLNFLRDCVIVFEFKSVNLRSARKQTHFKSNRGTTVGVPQNTTNSDSLLKSESQKVRRQKVQITNRNKIKSYECTMIVLDALFTFTQHLDLSMISHIKHVMSIYLLTLGLNQSESCLLVLMDRIQKLVMQFSQCIFDVDAKEDCSELCLRLLQYITSRIPSVRTSAASLLYFLMKKSFNMGNCFARLKIQVTVSLSWLVGHSTDHQYNENHLRNGLKYIRLVSENDLDECDQRMFVLQIRDLVHNLNTIIEDTMKMRNHKGDPELIIDLMHRVANCYQTNPDLRLTWLQNMAQSHLQRSSYMEAGQCLLHGAALVAEYLAMQYHREYMPVGCAVLQNVSINVLEESAVSHRFVMVELLCPALDDTCTGSYTSEQGFIGLLEQAAIFFVHAQAYELVNEIYKVLIPIFDANRDFKKLAQIHGKLHEYFNKISNNQDKKRVFGTYFRVAFHGDLFDELDAIEFIYKEPGVTKLPEIAQKLEVVYGNKFGSDRVEIIRNSNCVDRKSLDLASKAYIQVTYVEPYFDSDDLRHRQTHFEMNNNLRRFVYSTPFTLTGKFHGELKDQYQRRIILTTQRAFPYMKTRIAVVHQQQFVLTPIEVAIEDVQKKCEELRHATSQELVDLKYLQVVLQGCVSTKVNAGPLEIANQFLRTTAEECNGTTINNDIATNFADFKEKLKYTFNEFIYWCNVALNSNRNLIGLDQKEYHKELEREYKLLCDEINPLILEANNEV